MVGREPSISATSFGPSMPIRFALHRVCIEIVAFEQLAFFSRSALPPELASANGDHFILAVTVIDAYQHRHSEDAVWIGSALPLELHWIDSEDVDLFILLIEAPLFELIKRVDVELVLLLDVLYVFLDFEEVRGESGPALGRVDPPDVDFAAFDTGCGNIWAGGVPLYSS